MKTKVVIVRLEDACQNEGEALTALLESADLQEVGNAFQNLDSERLCAVARKLHGALYLAIS